MSKELTEQWQNGTLPFGMYYVKTTDGVIRTDETVYLVGKKRYRWRHTDICWLEEIIAPVPTYKEYLKLESDSLAKQEGVEIVAELEDRLKEAESLIYYVANNSRYGPIYEPTYVYCQKYGVKK